MTAFAAEIEKGANWGVGTSPRIEHARCFAERPHRAERAEYIPKERFVQALRPHLFPPLAGGRAIEGQGRAQFAEGVFRRRVRGLTVEDGGGKIG